MARIEIRIDEINEDGKEVTTSFDLQPKQTRKLVGLAEYCGASLKVVFNYLLNKTLEDTQAISTKTALDNKSGKSL